MVPLFIFKSISIYAICLFAVLNRFNLLIFTYICDFHLVYAKNSPTPCCSISVRHNRMECMFAHDGVAIYYQAGRDHSATKSGVDILPLMLSVVVSIVISGQIVGMYYSISI